MKIINGSLTTKLCLKPVIFDGNDGITRGNFFYIILWWVIYCGSHLQICSSFILSNLVLSTELILKIGHPKEFLKLMFGLELSKRKVANT